MTSVREILTSGVSVLVLLTATVCASGAVGNGAVSNGEVSNSTPRATVQSFVEAVESGNVASAKSLVDQSTEQGKQATVMVEGLVTIAGAMDEFKQAVIDKFGESAWAKNFAQQAQDTMDVSGLADGLKVQQKGNEAMVSVEGQDQKLRLVKSNGNGWKLDLAATFGPGSGQSMDKVAKVVNGMAGAFKGLDTLVADYDDVQALKGAFAKRLMQQAFSSMLSGTSASGGTGGAGSQTKNLPNEIHLLSGDVIRGQIIHINKNGIVIQPATGGPPSGRIHWSELSQRTLKDLSDNPQAEKFTFPYIEIPPKKENPDDDVVVSEVEHLDRTEVPTGMFAAFGTQVGLFLLGILFITNIYAGYAVANYRDHPPALAGAISAVFPVLGPIIFLSLPTRSFQSMEEGVHPEAEGEATMAEGSEVPEAEPVGEPAEGAGAATNAGGLSINQKQAAASGGGDDQSQLYSRDDYEFDRNFFETSFPNFFRVIRTGSDKDLVMVIRTPKTEYVGKRISRISGKELHLQLQQGTKEVKVPFGEITEVELRRKDAKK